MQNTLITVEKAGKQEWQTLLWEFRANNLGNRVLAMSAVIIFFFSLSSVLFLLQSEISHLSHHFPEMKTTVVLSYV